LAARNAAIPVGSVEAERGGTWAGVQALAEELAGETGQSLPRAAVEELARRTLRGEATGKDSRASAASTARFAAEYRKLADLAASETVDRSTVERVVADRGEEDVWQILDALGAGRLGEALERCERALQGAADPVAARLQLF